MINAEKNEVSIIRLQNSLAALEKVKIQYLALKTRLEEAALKNPPKHGDAYKLLASLYEEYKEECKNKIKRIDALIYKYNELLSLEKSVFFVREPRAKEIDYERRKW